MIGMKLNTSMSCCIIHLGPTLTHTMDCRCSCRKVYQDFFIDIIPSLKASFRLHRISSGIKLRPLKDSLRRYFSTPCCLHRTNNTIITNNYLFQCLFWTWDICSKENSDLSDNTFLQRSTDPRNLHLLRQGEVVCCESVVQEGHSELQTLGQNTFTKSLTHYMISSNKEVGCWLLGTWVQDMCPTPTELLVKFDSVVRDKHWKCCQTTMRKKNDLVT